MTPPRLKKFREAQRVHIETLEGQPYKAFDVSTTAQRRLELQPGREAQRIFSYGALFDITHAAGIVIGLSFSMPRAEVDIRGKNLQELVDALREERAVVITEHVPDWHAPPTEEQPYIKILKIKEAGKPNEENNPAEEARKRH